MKKPWLRYAVILLLTIVFLYLFFRRVEWIKVFQSITDVNLVWFIIMILLAPLHLITRALRWDYLLKHEKKGVSFYNRFAANAVGFTVSMIFPGRLGEIVRPIYLAKKENMKKGFVLGTIVVERIFDVFTMCFILGVFLVSKPLYASIFIIDEEIYSKLYFWGIAGISFAAFFLIITICLYFFKEKTLSVIKFLLRPVPQKISEKILELSEEFIQGLRFFHSLKDLFIYILLSFVVWLGIILFYWIFLFAYNVSIPFFFLFPFVFMLMIGASIPTPGMVGGFHYFSKLGLISFYNIDANLATGMTIVMHGVQVIMTCLIGYVILWKEGTSIFQVKKISKETNK
jgi:uncharacterized protein (TIRG00374 family)